MSDFNPYSQSSLPDNIPLTESAVRFGFFLPAIGVILFSALHIPATIAGYAFIQGSGEISWTSSQSTLQFVVPSFAMSCVSVLYSLALIIGGIGIFRRGSYAWVLTTCILELVPIGGHFYFLAMPFGIWGLTVLARPGAREALNSKHRR